MRDRVVAVVGATGAVGQEMLRVLAERRFPVGELRAFASPRSAGTRVVFAGREIVVRALDAHAFDGVEVALFSAGADRAREWAPVAVRAGAVVVDNSSAFRLQDGVPLVVPEVNPADAHQHRGIIANPNCSTIQMVVALRPLRDLFGLRRITVATYQSVSGTGARAIRELERTSREYLAGAAETREVYPRPIAFDVLPQVADIGADGHTVEENKMRDETRKIFADSSIVVHATCARVPVFRSHSEAVVAETERPVDLATLCRALRSAPGLVLREEAGQYPMAREAAGRDEVFVGRLRGSADDPRVVSMWVVSDNLRKGAATNAVQIAELLCQHAAATGEAGRWQPRS
jgi:aspartate-semialdehyde dehydrogenase